MKGFTLRGAGPHRPKSLLRKGLSKKTIKKGGRDLPAPPFQSTTPCSQLSRVNKPFLQ